MDARNPYRYAPNGLTVVKVCKVVFLVGVALFHGRRGGGALIDWVNTFGAKVSSKLTTGNVVIVEIWFDIFYIMYLG